MLAIASAIIVGIFVVQYFRYRTAVAQSKADTDEPAAIEVERLRSEVAALKERVEVLEKIVTDQRYDLQTKIASL
jgi:hypothetical protein